MSNNNPVPDRPAELKEQGREIQNQASAQAGAGGYAAHTATQVAQLTTAPRKPATGRDKRQILKARAQELAREPQGKADAGGSIEIVEFVLADERYAVESVRVREVYPLRELVPLPCTPTFVLGIINLRGQILPVIDIRRFFDLPIRGITDLNKLIILEWEDAQVGMLADAVVDVRLIPLDDLQPALPTMTGVRAQYLRGVTGERLVVLDAAKILSDPKLVVHEEVEE